MEVDNPRGHLAFLIHDAAKRLRDEFGSRAARLQLTPAQARCLIFLAYRSGTSLKTLAGVLEVHSMSLLRVIDELETRRLLRRRSDPKDRRALQLFITRTGEALVDRVWKLLDEIIDDACHGMTAKGRQELARALTLFSAGIGAPEPALIERKPRR